MARVGTRTRAAAVASPAMNKDITSFGRTIKSAIAPSPLDAKKKAAVVIEAVPVPASTQSRKRKSRETEEDEENVAPASEPVVPSTPSKAIKRARVKAETDQTEVSIAVPTPASDVPTHVLATPSKSRIAALNVQTPVSSEKRSARTPRSGRVDASAKIGKRTAAKKPTVVPNNARIEDFFQAIRRQTKSGLPAEFDDFLTLHTAFMRTAVVQIAHNGASDLLTMRDILPHVTRNWGKRTVTLDDIRHIVAIQTHNGGSSPFEVTEFGRLMCLRLITDRAIDVAAMCIAFETNLRALCTAQATDRAPTSAPEDISRCLSDLSLADMPQAPIKHIAAPAPAARPNVLEQLRAAVAKPVVSTIPTTDPATGEPLTVLQRIRLKEAAKRNALNASADDMRKGMLQRAQHVAGTVEMMVQPDGMCRQSFTLAGLTTRVQDSFPSPIEAGEVRVCLEMIARELAPEWLRLKEVRGREFVILERDSFPGTAAIHNRVLKLSSA